MTPANEVPPPQTQHEIDLQHLQGQLQQLLVRMPVVARHALEGLLLRLVENPSSVASFESGLAQGYILAAQQRNELTEDETAALCAFVQELRNA